MPKLRFHPRTLSALLAVSLLAGCSTESSHRDIADIEHMCSSCHGINGVSVNPTFPILASQQPDYLVNELVAFRDHTRAERDAHTYMWGMAIKLSDAEIDQLAKFYAAKPAAPGRAASPQGQAAGAKIYFNGVPEANVPACKKCHGETAQGAPKNPGAPSYPRLAGQHRDYLAAQLLFFSSMARQNPTMHDNAMNLTQQQIDALADFLSGL